MDYEALAQSLGGTQVSTPTPVTPVNNTAPKSGVDYAALAAESGGVEQPPAPQIDGFGTMLQKAFSGTISGLKQFGTGFDQTVQGVKEGDFSKIGRGVFNEAAGGINTVFSPIGNVLNTASELPVVKQGLDLVKTYAIDPTADVIATKIPVFSPALQKFMIENPNADEVAGNLITLGVALAGGNKSAEIKNTVENTLSPESTTPGFKETPLFTGENNSTMYADPNGNISRTPPSEAAPTQQMNAHDIQLQNEIDAAKAKVADTYQKSMPLTPTQQVQEARLLKNTGDNVYTTLAKYNVSPAAEDATAQLQSLSDQFREATNYAKDNEHAYFNIDEIKNNAYKSINDNLSSATERKSAQAKIDTEISDLMKESPKSFTTDANGNIVANSDIVERLRQTGNDWAQYNRLNPDSVKNATGRGLADSVRSQVEKEGTFPAYREANQEWGKVIHAQEILQKIEDSGKTFKQLGGLSGTIARRVLSGVLGFHLGGFGGAILSELGSEYGSKILSNPDLRTYFNRKLIEEFGNTDATPQAINRLTQEIKNHIDTQDKLLKLPAPNYITVQEFKGGNGTPRVSADQLNKTKKP